MGTFQLEIGQNRSYSALSHKKWEPPEGYIEAEPTIQERNGVIETPT